MSNASSKTVNKKATSHKTKLKVVPGEEETRYSLKHSFWKSTLFNEIYLDQDIYRKEPGRWDLDGKKHFEDYHNDLLNLFIEWDEEKVKGWTEGRFKKCYSAYF